MAYITFHRNPSSNIGDVISDQTDGELGRTNYTCTLGEERRNTNKKGRAWNTWDTEITKEDN
jgi:hypothetical protein